MVDSDNIRSDPQPDGTVLVKKPYQANSSAAKNALRLIEDVKRASEAAYNLGDAVAALETTTSAQSARSVQATENVLRTAIKTFEMLDSKDADEEIGARPGTGRARAWRRANKLLGIDRGNRVYFPQFQFDKSGQVRPSITELLNRAEEKKLTQNELALWLFSPSNTLDGKRPVDRLDDLKGLDAAFAGAFEVEW